MATSKLTMEIVKKSSYITVGKSYITVYTKRKSKRNGTVTKGRKYVKNSKNLRLVDWK